MTEARRAGEVDRGWLPEILPNGATNVRERHNIEIADHPRTPLGKVVMAVEPLRPGTIGADAALPARTVR